MFICLFPCKHGTPLLLERGDALGEVAGGVTLGLRRGLAQERGLQPRGLRLLPRAQRRYQRAHCDWASLTHLHVHTSSQRLRHESKLKISVGGYLEIYFV